MEYENLIKILQACIAPCVLISAIGLLLLSMTNRLARPIDRIRILCREIERADAAGRVPLQSQVKILYKRCCFLQSSIIFSICSIFAVSSVILLLFLGIVFNLQTHSLIKLLFAACLICMIISLVYFLLDIRTSLNSVKIEIDKFGI